MFRTVTKQPDFPQLERDALHFWKVRDIFRKQRARLAGRPRWSFLDGPITANNPMGVHHAWGRAYKDVFQRYNAMLGHDQRFQNGFDCQGLWVEVEVEKALGLKTKKDIPAYGIDRFIRDCKERVLTFAARQTEQSIRLGNWMEWDDPKMLLALRDALHEGRDSITVTTASGRTVTDHPERIVARLGSPEYGGSYFTFSDENNYSIWSFLKKCYEEGFIYRGHDVIPWCIRCGSGLSQMEVAEGRRIISHTAVFVRFPVVGQDKTALLVWTTTPWTLTSNVALAVNPKLTYLKVRHGDWVYYLGKGNFEGQRVQDLQVEGQRDVHKLRSLRDLLKTKEAPEVIGEVAGASLVGLRFQGPFDDLPAQHAPGGVFAFGPTGGGQTAVECHRVIPWDEVSEAEGTGIVHIAPGCGAEDQALGKEHGLVAIAPLGESGEFVPGFGEFTGQNVLGVADAVVKHLRAHDRLVARESYPHVYPQCWRCKTELVFRPVDEWFIRMDWRNRIQRVVPTVRWIPPDGEDRELDWLANMGDWMISKKRFWGLALPIWVCDSCQHFTVIGSREELKEKATAGWDVFDGHTPHRLAIDAVKIACERCGGVASRVEDVGTPWLDAGIVPFSTLRYRTDPEYWEKWFPADFIVECFPGQFRNWFYALLAMSALLDGRAPFKTLMGYALVRDARGEEMHKSRGNAIDFDEAAEVMGAEVMRYLFARQRPTQNLNFPDVRPASDAKATLDGEARRKLGTLWNCYNFFVTYALADDWRPVRPAPAARPAELDRWVLSRLQRFIATARDALDNYAPYRLVEGFEDFSEDLSNWYLRRSRRRFWRAESDEDKEAAYQTLYRVLVTVTRVIAPVLPFLSEEMYQNLVPGVDPEAPESVHLTSYPEVDEALVDPRLEESIGTVLRLKNLALGLRMRAKVKIRQPLGTLVVKPRDAREREVLQDPSYREQVLEETNIKSLRLIGEKQEVASLAVEPNLKALGPKFGRHLNAVLGKLKSADPAAVATALRTTGGFEVAADSEPAMLGPEDVRVYWKTPDHLAAAEDQGTFVALDTTITTALRDEGIARDFNRHVQEYRRDLGLAVSDRIVVRYAAGPGVRDAIAANVGYLRGELLADRIEPVEAPGDGLRFKLDGSEVVVSVAPVTRGR
jgi:isoleucyl-tRNA synthetase